jgi:CPA2 family monovalent cation:H+ antiporter-2
MASARGEISLIIAKAGQDVGAISSSVFPILGIVTIVTAFMTSYVIKFGGMIRLSSALASGERKKGSRH